MTMQTHSNGAPADAVIERVIALGDLKELRPAERTSFYLKVCGSLGLNPMTQPFAYIVLNGKLTLYAKKDTTDQLRKIHNISISIVGRETDADGVYTVTARATMASGRQDESTGCVTIGGLKGENLANAKMKAETKAKRRVTLSICGLGWLDETEVADVKGAKHVVVTDDGEIIEPDLSKQLAQSVEQNWSKWLSGSQAVLREAAKTGQLLSAWTDISDEIKAKKPPRDIVEAITATKDELKVSK